MPESPPFWQAYLKALATRPANKRQLLSEVEFVVFDTETTGLDPKRDQILSIGAVRACQWQIEVSDRFEYALQQEYTPAPGTVAVHGILPGRKAGNLPEGAAIQEFLAYCEGRVLVAHHAAFDLAMLEAGLKKMGGGKLQNHILDTGVLAQRVSPRSKPYGLDELLEVYGITPSDRHTAAGDAYMTALLLFKLLFRLEQRGVKTLGGLLKKPRKL